MKVIVLNNQSLFDLAIRYSGTTEAAFKIALANDLSIDSTLIAGSEVIIPEVMRKDVVSYFNSKNHQPATAWNEQDTEITPALEGISHWAIHVDFVVTEIID